MVKCVQNTMVNVFFQCTVDNFFTSVHSGKTYFQCTVVKCALAVKKETTWSTAARSDLEQARLLTILNSSEFAKKQNGVLTNATSLN